MSKILEDHGDVRVRVGDKIKYVHELLLDCGCTLAIDVRDIYDALNSDLLIKLRVAEHKCEKPKQLPEFSATTENPIIEVHHQDDDRDRQIAALTREVGMWKDKYDHLNNIYCKLADQWNAFQATNRPDNRNVHRAEAAGEVTRKMAEVFMALAYDHDAFDLIATLLEMLRELQQGGAGRTVEVSERLVPHRG